MTNKIYPHPEPDSDFRSCGFCVFNDKDINEFPCTKCRHDLAGCPENEPSWYTKAAEWEAAETAAATPDPTATVANKTCDAVNHPYHYTRGGIECIDALEAMVTSYTADPVLAGLAWQVMKYVWRAPLKENLLQDLKKADFYLDRMIAHLEEN